MKTYSPTGRQLADLARAAKCNVDVFKEGSGADALAAIVKAAQDAVQVAPAAGDHPQSCWRCKSTEFDRHAEQGTVVSVRCIQCGAKYSTPKAVA